MNHDYIPNWLYNRFAGPQDEQIHSIFRVLELAAPYSEEVQKKIFVHIPMKYQIVLCVMYTEEKILGCTSKRIRDGQKLNYIAKALNITKKRAGQILADAEETLKKFAQLYIFNRQFAFFYLNSAPAFRRLYFFVRDEKNVALSQVQYADIIAYILSFSEDELVTRLIKTKSNGIGKKYAMEIVNFRRSLIISL